VSDTTAPATIAEFWQAYAAVSFTHFVYHSPAPHDEETLERFATEVCSHIDKRRWIALTPRQSPSTAPDSTTAGVITLSQS